MTQAGERMVHLVRHGEVWNPDHVVYSDLPGFGLTALGHRQARDAAVRLAERPVTAVVASPLQRAIETAIPIAAAHGLRVAVDPGLVEWRLSQAWVGKRWDDLPRLLPGQLEAYLEHPADLDFAEETLGDLAARVEEAVRRWHSESGAGDLVVVSHQDPIQVGRVALTGRSLASFNDDKPAHAAIVTLDPAATPWVERGVWTPQQSDDGRDVRVSSRLVS